MKVASYNIHKCRGTDGIVAPDRIIKVIAEINADVVALQEVDRRFGIRRGVLDPVTIERETGLHLLVQSDVPEGHGWHGNAILVRGEPKSYHRIRLNLPGVEPRGAVVADIDMGEGPFRLIATHLGLFRRSRIEQVATLLSAVRDLSPIPTILLGDFNEWRRGRRSALRGLEPLFGFTPLIPSFPSPNPVLPLDRILAWPPGLASEITAHDTLLARRASDHLPLTATIDLTGSLSSIQHAA